MCVTNTHNICGTWKRSKFRWDFVFSTFPPKSNKLHWGHFVCVVVSWLCWTWRNPSRQKARAAGLVWRGNTGQLHLHWEPHWRWHGHLPPRRHLDRQTQMRRYWVCHWQNMHQFSAWHNLNALWWVLLLLTRLKTKLTLPPTKNKTTRSSEAGPLMVAETEVPALPW